MNWIQKIVASIGIDKITHFAVSAFIAIALGKFVHWAIALAITVAIGFAKELTDSRFDWKDILADSLGILIATLINII